MDMYTHFIAISNSYSQGIRWGWHYTAEKFDPHKVTEFMKLLTKNNSDVQIGTHIVNTTSLDWSSVVQKDDYFKNVKLIPKIFDFIKLSRRDSEVKALDIAKYIISKTSVTNLKLQKLLYLSYEKYLLSTQKLLFQEDILAWRYGPVVKSVYDEYKTHKREEISTQEDDVELIENNEEITKPLSYLRLLSSDVGLEGISVIDQVIQEYKHLDAYELVSVTHQAGKPWSKVDINDVISPEIISSCFDIEF